MKKKGVTLIESVIAIAILGVIFLLIAPLIRSFGNVNNRVKTQKEIDAEFSVVNEFLQKKIRAAKRTSDISPFSNDNEDEFNVDLKYASVYKDFYNNSSELFHASNRVADGDHGNVLVLEIPFTEETGEDKDNDNESLESQFEIFTFVNGALKYKVIDYTDNTTFGNFEILIDSVEVYSGNDVDEQLQNSNFTFNEGIIIYYINLEIGGSEDKFRDSFKASASSRIDIK